MNKFVNFNNRSIELPPGCKNLIDVLANLPPPPSPGNNALAVEGFSHIEHYLSRLLKSAALRSSLFIWSLDYREYLYVSKSKRTSNLKLTLQVDPEDSVRDQALLGFFQAARITPMINQDCRADGISVRILIYQLSKVVPDSAELLSSFLQEVYGIAPDAGLIFQYHEKEAIA